MKIRITKMKQGKKLYVFGNKTFTEAIMESRIFENIHEAVSHVNSWGSSLSGDNDICNIEIEFDSVN